VTVGADTQITDLSVNDHACLTFGDAEELFDLTAAFVRDGLSGGLKVLWLNDVPAQQALSELGQRGVDVQRALAAGQMVTSPCEGSVLAGQAFTPGAALAWLNGQIAACQQAGFAGLRVAVDMSWALQPVTGVEQLPEFEEQAAAALPGTRVSLLCQYDRERFDPVTLAQVAAFHDHSVAAATYHADPVLRVCRQYTPPGIRLAGEIDFQAEEPLALALTEAIRIEGDITVHMTALTFIDAGCTRMLINAARSLPPSRRMVVRCLPTIARMFSLMGGDEVPNMTVMATDGR
jgi:anti-anti-sigma regulatory factor